MRLLLLAILLLLVQMIRAQAPVAAFNASPAACKLQLIDLQNTSSNADRYEWDFCLDDLSTVSNSVNLGGIAGLSFGEGLKLIEDNGVWYGFATSSGSNKLFRLDFGSSPENMPVINNLGNIGGLLHVPEGLDIVKANGNWFGFIGSLDFASPSQGIIRIDFGSSLTNTPSALNLGNFGYNTRFRNLKIVQQGSSQILILVSYNSDGTPSTGGTIIRINYGNSFDNLITASAIFDSGFINGLDLPTGMGIVQSNANWIMHITSFANGIIKQLNFGSDILSAPVLEGTYNFGSVNNPTKIEMVREGSSYYGVVSNFSQALSILNFNDLNPLSTPVEVPHVNLPGLAGISTIRWLGKSIVIGLSNSTNELRRIVFESVCGSSSNYSTSLIPTIFYSTGGTKKIELRANQTATDITSIAYASLTVSSLSAPDIGFATDGAVCALNDVNFASQNSSSDITAYSWDFGDTNTSAQPNPSHIYTSAGTYPVELQVTASNGCTNFSQSDLTIYNQPISDFSLLSAPPPICSNQTYFYTNTSTFDPASNPTWEWRLNGNLVSTTTNLNQAFSSTSTQVIKLNASIPGCSNESTQTINGIQTGPLVDFSASTGCQGSALQFTNNTSGTVISYSWDFGDGNISSQISPTNTYSTFGNFNATLHADNGVCNNSATKPITIYSKPQPNFSLDLPPFSCQGTPSQFNDLTPNPTDSNLSLWSWNFGDAGNGTSGQRNPVYTYLAAGPYNVSLDVITNFGCSASFQKMVTITAAPPVNFSNMPACVNQPTQFTDASGAGVKSWLWKIDNSTYIINNPMHTFTTSGPHNVELTITGANDCIAQMIKTVMVPVAVSPDFSVENACSGKPSTFLDITSGGADPVVTRNWDFAGMASTTGASPQYTFAAGGSYAVKLNTAHQSGCVYLATKTVTIGTSPKSLFTSSTEGGPPPLTIKFSNSSTGASSYLWKFNDKTNTTSLLTEPSFTFNELGEYQVELTSFGQQGCADTFIKPIYIVEPKTDLSLTSLELLSDPNSGSLRPLVTIKNNGNIAVANFSILIDLSGGGSIKEKMQINLQPNQSFTQALVSELLPNGLNYVCAQVILEKDENLFDNKRCSLLEDDVILFAPYPNPCQGQLYMDWIAASGDVANLVIFNSTGANAYEKKITATQPGLSQIILDISTLGPGIYFVVFSYGSFTKTHRFMVN